jgi:hypothetical protein
MAAKTHMAQGAQGVMPKAEQQSKEEACLQQLAGMGFTNSAECKLLLQQFSCDMAQVTDRLIASRQGGSTTDAKLKAQSRRIGDVSGNHGTLPPIMGVLKAPQLSLMDAAACTGVSDVDAMAYIANERGCLLARDDPHGLTTDEAGALTLYTMEGELYPNMNNLLRERNRTLLTPFFPYMRLMMSARRKLPVFRGNVWRGVAGKDLRSQFVKGVEMYWWSFSSASKELSTLQNPMFLGQTGVRTQFLIEVLHGVDIMRYSIYQGKALPGWPNDIIIIIMHPALLHLSRQGSSGVA